MPSFKARIKNGWRSDYNRALVFNSDRIYSFLGNGYWTIYKMVNGGIGDVVESGTWRYDPNTKDSIQITDNNKRSETIRITDFPAGKLE